MLPKFQPHNLIVNRLECSLINEIHREVLKGRDLADFTVEVTSWIPVVEG